MGQGEDLQVKGLDWTFLSLAVLLHWGVLGPWCTPVLRWNTLPAGLVHVVECIVGTYLQCSCASSHVVLLSM